MPRVDVTAISANFFRSSASIRCSAYSPPRTGCRAGCLHSRGPGTGATPIAHRRTRGYRRPDHTVVGVIPARFTLLLPAEAFVTDAQIWKPLRFYYANAAPQPDLLHGVRAARARRHGRAGPSGDVGIAGQCVRRRARFVRHADSRRAAPGRHRQACRADVARAARRGCLRAADRVRERGASAAGAGDGSSARDGAACRARRPRVATGAATGDRKLRARRRGRTGWPGPGVDGLEGSAIAGCRGSPAWTPSVDEGLATRRRQRDDGFGLVPAAAARQDLRRSARARPCRLRACSPASATSS